MPSYSEKLKDKRWQQKRLQLFEAANWKCQSPKCASRNQDSNTLHVHHKLYLRNTEPWDYESWAYQVLCEECHSRMQHKMELAHTALAKYPGLLWFASTLEMVPKTVAVSTISLTASLLHLSICSSHITFSEEAMAEVFTMKSGDSFNP